MVFVLGIRRVFCVPVRKVQLRFCKLWRTNGHGSRATSADLLAENHIKKIKENSGLKISKDDQHDRNDKLSEKYL